MKKIIRRFAPQWVVNNLKHRPNAALANLRYYFPSRKLIVIGVTGTDGKTTTVNMIYQILKSAGKRVSMVSTINAVVGGKVYDTGFHVTSPSSNMIQRFLRQSVKNKDEIMVLEVTSHALDQHRFAGIKFDIGVVTNVTHEHLDYHKTFENYSRSKAKLIRRARVAVLNRDDVSFDKLSKLASGKVVSFGSTKHSNFNPLKFPLKLKIPGQFNILNGLAASAVCVELGVDSKLIRETLTRFESLPGRMEEIENDLGIKIVIDFAHTPNGLINALKALRKGSGKLIAIIGAEGYRDLAKRAMMGESAMELADVVIVTSVDPRGQIKEINSMIREGAMQAGAIEGENFFEIVDRKKAIEFAINLAKKGDIVGIFGKGHETSMNLDGKEEISWSDKEAVEWILSSN